MLSGVVSVLGTLVALLGAVASLVVAVLCTRRRTNALAAWVLVAATSGMAALPALHWGATLAWRYLSDAREPAVLMWSHWLISGLGVGVLALFGVAFLLFRPEPGAEEPPR